VISVTALAGLSRSVAETLLMPVGEIPKVFMSVRNIVLVTSRIF